MTSVLSLPYVGQMVILFDNKKKQSYAASVAKVTERFFYVGHDKCYLEFRISNWQQATVYDVRYSVKPSDDLSIEIN